MHILPRDFLVDPETFGTAPARWKAVSAATADVVAGAWLQHCLAQAVLRSAGRGVAEHLAAACSESRSNISRKLRGQVPASLEDLARWALLVGDDVLQALPRAALEALPVELRGRDASWRPGQMRLPTLTLTSAAALDWSAIVSATAERLRSDPAAQPFVDRNVLRYMALASIGEQGVAQSSLYADEPRTPLGAVAASVGTRPDVAIDVVIARAGLSAQQDRRSVTAVLASFARPAFVDASARLVLVLGAGAPSAAFDLDAVTLLGSSSAENAGAKSPLESYWEVETTLIAKEGVGAENLWLFAVGKLREA